MALLSSEPAPPTPAALRALARERSWPTRELHQPNCFYGHATVLRRYAGLPADRPVKAVLEHAPVFHADVWELEARSGLPLCLTAAPWRAELFERASGIRSVAIGPFIRYAPPDPPAAAERHLLLFPAHSTLLTQARFDLDALLAALEGARAEFDRVTACVYWRDVLDGLPERLRAAGIPSVTAGHFADQAFLERLASILASASHVVTNEVGSHIVYAAALGRPVWLLEQEIVRSPTAGPLPPGHDDGWEHPNVARVRELFGRRTDALTPEQRAFLDDVVGLDRRLAPEQLRALLEDAERAWGQAPLARRGRALALREARNAAQRARGVRDAARARIRTSSASA